MIDAVLTQRPRGRGRSNLPWGFALVACTGCVSLGLAFAQTRPIATDAKARTDANATPSPTQMTSNEASDHTLTDTTIRFRLVDPDGRPVAGAKVGGYAEVYGEVSLARPMRPQVPASDEKGEVLFDISTISRREAFRPSDLEQIRAQRLPQGAVYVLHKERSLGAIYGLTDADAGKSFDVRLQPLCRVRGTLSSPGLATTMTLNGTCAQVQWQKIRILQQSSRKQEFEFPLPPGEYTVLFDGDVLRKGTPLGVPATQRLSFTITPEQRHLDLGDIKLRAMQLATLIGQPAPELGLIRAWKNGPPVTLEQLRGGVVLLYFGGEYPSAGDISSLASLQDKFGSQGLTVLAIYNCASMEDLAQRWPRNDPNCGKMENVPFRILLDGDGPTGAAAMDRTRRGATFEKYGADTVLINQAGIVVGPCSDSRDAPDVIQRMLSSQRPMTELALQAFRESEWDFDENEIRLRLVDLLGRPVAGAKVVNTMAVKGRMPGDGGAGSWLLRDPGPSDDNGRITLRANSYCGTAGSVLPVYILHEERGIGAVAEIGREDWSETLPVVLRPVCRVRGRFDSSGLATVGMPLQEVGVHMCYGSTHFDLPADGFPVPKSGANHDWTNFGSLTRRFTAPNLDFDFLVPAGIYTMSFQGWGGPEKVPLIAAFTEPKIFTLAVPAGRSDLDLGVIDLRPTKWAARIGHPAPEIGPMKAWKNGPPVTLAQLKGNVVWLHFGAPYDPWEIMVRLLDLHEPLGDKGLTILVIDNDASLDELQGNWDTHFKGVGGIREVPFRIAIDGDATGISQADYPGRPAATFERYGIGFWPTDVLIDRAGNVVGQPTDAYHARELISRTLGVQ